MDECELRRILSQDLSADTETFRDELLVRCLEVLGEDDASAELGDEELELLAAAGDVSAALELESELDTDTVATARALERKCAEGRNVL